LSKVFFGATVLAISAGAASAAVVCNEDGDCWRVTSERTYPPELGLTIHPDDWTFERGDRYRWRDAGEGHGYYRDGTRVEIDD